VHVRKVKLADNIDLSILARGTPGMSGADLANMVNEAALLAAREGLNQVTMDVFEKAKDKVLMGSERRSLVITDDEKQMIAYHEGGHALVSRFLPGCDPIHKVTIIPRGRALGLTVQLPVDERHTHNRHYLENMLSVMMGGRVAELIVFDQLTTGASNDLERATKLARKMVCNWGMSDSLGPVTFGRTEEHIFLGREMSHAKDYSEDTAVAIDREIKVLIEAAEKKAHEILTEHRGQLDSLASALLEKEMIDGPEMDRIIGMSGGDPKQVETPAPTPIE
jgi:cell division protease FtsH